MSDIDVPIILHVVDGEEEEALIRDLKEALYDLFTEMEEDLFVDESLLNSQEVEEGELLEELEALLGKLYSSIIEEVLKRVEDDLKSLSVVGEAGAGLVKAVATGLGEIIKIEKDEKFESLDPELQEELTLAAINQAVSRAREEYKTALARSLGSLMKDVAEFISFYSDMLEDLEEE